MKNTALTIICIVLGFFARAQVSPPKLNVVKLYKTDLLESQKKQIAAKDSFFSVRDFSRPVYYKIVSRDFLSIARGDNENPGTASYAFADVASPNVSLGAAFVLKRQKDTLCRTLLSFNAKAGITENTTQLFSNTKFNSTFSGQLLLSRLIGFRVYASNKVVGLADAQRRSVMRSMDSVHVLGDKYQKILESVKKVHDLVVNNENVDTIWVRQFHIVSKPSYKDTVIITKKDTLINGKIITLANMHRLVLFKTVNDTIPVVEPIIDTLKFHKINTAKILPTDIALCKMIYPEMHLEIRDTMTKEEIARLTLDLIALEVRATHILNTLQSKLTYVDFKGLVLDKFTEIRKRYTWLGWGVGATNTEFRLYNPNEVPLVNNISPKKSFLSWNLAMRVNHYQDDNLRGYGNFYFFGELTLGRSHNLADLTTTGYSRSHSVTDADTSKTVGDTYTVHRNPNGDQYKQYHFARLAFSHLHFLSKKRTVGLTGYISTEGRFAKHALPTFGHTDMGVGLYLSLPGKKKDDPVVNMELYGRFLDVGNAGKLRDSHFYDRNLVAVKIGVPFRLVTQ